MAGREQGQDRYVGGVSEFGWCKDRWALSWQIIPRALTEALAAGGGEAKPAFEAMMSMKSCALGLAASLVVIWATVRA